MNAVQDLKIRKGQKNSAGIKIVGKEEEACAETLRRNIDALLRL